MSSERVNAQETVNNRTVRTVVILGIVIVWAFLLTMDANATLEGSGWKGEVPVSFVFVPGIRIACGFGCVEFQEDWGRGSFAEILAAPEGWK